MPPGASCPTTVTIGPWGTGARAVPRPPPTRAPSPPGGRGEGAPRALPRCPSSRRRVGAPSSRRRGLLHLGSLSCSRSYLICTVVLRVSLLVSPVYQVRRRAVVPRGIQGRAEHGSNTTVQIRPLGPEVVAGLRRLRGGQLGQVQRLPATAPSASLARAPRLCSPGEGRASPSPGRPGQSGPAVPARPPALPVLGSRQGGLPSTWQWPGEHVPEGRAGHFVSGVRVSRGRMNKS